MHRALVLGLLVTLIACESGTAEFVSIDVPDDLAESFSPQAPGLLRTDGGYELVATLCGEPLPEPAELSNDHGFGCLEDDLDGLEVARQAWVEPMPEAWDAEALCAMPPADPAWRGLVPDAEITGSAGSFAEDLAAEIDPAWPQAVGFGSWKRDLSPCGGSLRVEIDL